MRGPGSVMRGPGCAVSLLPHAVIILSLIGYALLGAALFRAIEGGQPANRTRQTPHDYRSFVRDVVKTVRNQSAESEDSVLDVVGQKILKDYKAVWSQRPERWHFYGSLFFCCTVFTTVGYGEIYPVTLAGRVVCILYAMVGIPLMLLVITDVGDILAVLFSNSYNRLRSSCKRLSHTRSRHHHLHVHYQDLQHHRKPPQPQDGAYFFSQDVVIVREAPASGQSTSLREKSKKIHKNNVEIFDRIVAREQFRRKGPLTRSLSCPELNQMPLPPHGFCILDSIGQEMERFNVPFLVILLVVFTYILSWALILPLWETDFSRFDAFYFCFITLTTIGFGDIVPKHPNFFMLTFLFIIMGMAIMSMAFKLGQSRIISCYRRLILCISCLGVSRAGRYHVERSLPSSPQAGPSPVMVLTRPDR